MVDPTLKQLNDNILMNFLMERLKYFVMIISVVDFCVNNV